MNVNTQISRGLERLMAQREGARLEGMFGLAGLGTIGTFGELQNVLAETGYRGGAKRVAKMRRAHGVMTKRIRAALPVAINARRLMEETGGDLSGIFSKIGKALKKVAKVAVKLSPSHQLLKKVAPKLAVFSPSQMLAMKLDAPKVKAATAIKAADAQALPPVEAAAAVLANQSGVALTTPEAQQYAQSLVSSGGGGGPAIQYPEGAAPVDAASDGTIFGMSPVVAAVAGAGVLGGIYLLTRKRRG